MKIERQNFHIYSRIVVLNCWNSYSNINIILNLSLLHYCTMFDFFRSNICSKYLFVYWLIDHDFHVSSCAASSSTAARTGCWCRTWRSSSDRRSSGQRRRRATLPCRWSSAASSSSSCSRSTRQFSASAGRPATVPASSAATHASRMCSQVDHLWCHAVGGFWWSVIAGSKARLSIYLTPDRSSAPTPVGRWALAMVGTDQYDFNLNILRMLHSRRHLVGTFWHATESADRLQKHHSSILRF